MNEEDDDDETYKNHNKSLNNKYKILYDVWKIRGKNTNTSEHNINILLTCGFLRSVKTIFY